MIWNVNFQSDPIADRIKAAMLTGEVVVAMANLTPPFERQLYQQQHAGSQLHRAPHSNNARCTPSPPETSSSRA